MAAGAATASKSLSVINSWAVEKYARFIISEPVSLIPQRSKAGSWKVNFRKFNITKIYGNGCYSCFQVIQVVRLD